ncbi:MAG: protein kinase [Polyangiaceae bacterium]|nr:protein kinase [Polyangiaceae bacterium]
MSSRSDDLATANTIASLPLSQRKSEFDDVVPDIPGYTILEELGRGGMGVVYRARQDALGREVALKMVLESHAQGESRVRFLAEAEAVARFHHPNIVQIYEIGEVQGRPFFSLEYVAGGNLEEQLAERPTEWKEAAEMLVLLAKAVHAAHQNGIVHRDLKPANVLLEKNRNPKITDFGIARRLDADRQTKTGNILGTPSYMAPEQALGKNDEIGPAADIYSLGAMLYDMLTGRPPFEAATTLDTLMQAVTRDPIPPRMLQPSIPLDIDVICLKCLEKKPERRYASAEALADDLQRLLRGEPIHARPIGRLERALRWSKRKPALATLMAVSVVALVALITTGGWFTRKLQVELKATEAARADAAAARNQLQMRLVRTKADSINSDLLQLSGVPKTLAAVLSTRDGWTETQINDLLTKSLKQEAHIFGMAVAFEPEQFAKETPDFCAYVFRDDDQLKLKQLLPPEYTPIYREWDWYKNAKSGGSWSKPYVDEGGGNIPMVTFSVPIERTGKRIGVVTADLSLDYFRALNESLKESDLGGTSYAMVVTSDGTIVSHPKDKWRFPSESSTNARPKDDAVLVAWERALSGEEGRALGSDLTNGEPAELLFAPVRSANWSCVAVVPQQAPMLQPAAAER